MVLARMGPTFEMREKQFETFGMFFRSDSGQAMWGTSWKKPTENALKWKNNYEVKHRWRLEFDLMDL